MRKLSLYVHIPFCKQKCNYCDFYSLSCKTEEDISEYVDALCVQIEREAHLYKNYEISTIFLGGGTPSLLTEGQMQRLVKTLYSSMNIAPCVEFSMEANPGTLTLEGLKVYRSLGINRISIGMQSTNDSELKILGRIHSFDEFKESFALARKAGFENINIDIMYGLPNQKIENFAKTLGDVCKLSPEHISAYALKIEPNTPFYKIKDTLSLPNEDEEYEMYIHLCSALENAGYKQYEISNFSKEGKECRHNLVYWQSGEYIGIGPSAHSFFDGKRYSYPASTKEYISAVKNNTLKKEYEEQSEISENSMDEFVMLSLRLAKGINLAEFKNKYGADLYEKYPKIRHFVGDFMKEEQGCVHFTPKGFFVSNYILSSILF